MENICNGQCVTETVCDAWTVESDVDVQSLAPRAHTLSSSGDGGGSCGFFSFRARGSEYLLPRGTVREQLRGASTGSPGGVPLRNLCPPGDKCGFYTLDHSIQDIF